MTPTKTVTLTPIEADALTVAATVDLLAGYIGPAIYNGQVVAVIGVGKPGYVAIASFEPIIPCIMGVAVEELALPIYHPEVRDRLVRVAAVGVRCPDECGNPPPKTGMSCTPNLCRTCKSTGYLRRPTDLSAFRDGPELQAKGWTSAQLSAALLYLSWVRLEAGMASIHQMAGPIETGEMRRLIEACTHDGRGWHVSDLDGGVLLRAGGTATRTDREIAAEVPE